MSAMSDDLENKILDHILGDGLTDYASITTLGLALFTADPTDAYIVGNEVTVGQDTNYARQTIAFGTARWVLASSPT